MEENKKLLTAQEVYQSLIYVEMALHQKALFYQDFMV